MKRLAALLLTALMALVPALAKGGAILDGRWLCADILGNVTEDTPEELQALSGDFPVLDMIRAFGLKTGSCCLVEEPGIIASLAGLYIEENAIMIRDWMTQPPPAELPAHQRHARAV